MKKKILIVDNDRSIVDVVCIILEMNGFQVFTYSKGTDVPELVHEVQPDLVLVGVVLAGNNGIAVCKELKDMYQDLPVILFSAHSKDDEAFSHCKADDFIQKPFIIKYLVQTINSHLSRS